MERVLILGCCGAGKSTLARKLQQPMNLDIIHLDQHYWLANWEKPDRDTWNKKVTALAQQDRWIMDGNYGGSLDIRLQYADQVIYLDRSTWTCMFRVIKRIARYYGRTRPDMPAGCPERLDWNFLHYVLVFNLVRAPKIKRKLEQLRADQSVYILKNERQIRQFIEALS